MQVLDKKMTFLFSVVLASFAAMFVLLSPAAKAQSSYGAIVGTVTDSSGAVVPNASVTVTNLGTNEKRTVQTSSAGEYRFVDLVPARYSVSVQAKSFARFLQDSVPVEVANTIRIDAKLTVGAATETVEVSTQPPLLQTDSGTLGSEIDGEQVQEMPLNGRNPMNLIALVPGVVPQGQTSGSATFNGGNHTQNVAWGNYQIGGGIAGQSSEYVDGAAVNVLGNSVGLVPTQDIVQEFKVSTNAVSAEFGRFSGGVVEMTTKGGANTWHGSAYEYVRNNIFNSNSFFSKNAGLPRPEWNQNQYGVLADGPIKRDKAFFMANWEGFSARLGIPTVSGVPTYNQEQGIFKGKITDPTGNCTIGYNAVTNISTIPSSCFDTTAVVMEGAFPTPSAATPDLNTVSTNPVGGTDSYQITGRVDYNVSAKQRAFARYTYWNALDKSENIYGLANTKINSGQGFSKNYTHQAVLGDTYFLNSTTILDGRLSYLRETYGNTPPTLGINNTQFGPGWVALAPQQTVTMIIGAHVSGPDNIQTLAGAGQYSHDTYNSYALGISLAKVTGSHTLKFGTELRSMQKNTCGCANLAGSFNFVQSVTGDEFAGFLLGDYQSASIGTGTFVSLFNNSQAYYATDTWQVNHKLTLDLGVRWELPGGIDEKKDRLTAILPNTPDPVTGYNGAVVLVNSALYKSRSALPVRDNLFAPRLSFAYRLRSSTTVNGGYGLSYLPPDLQLAASPLNAATTTISTTNYHGLQNPFGQLTGSAPILQPPGRTPNFITRFQEQAVVSPVPTNNYPYQQQWNLSVSTELGRTAMMQLAYVGAKGTHLPSAGNLGINELSSQYYSQGSALLNKTTWNGIPVTVGQSLRPYPYFQNLSNAGSHTGSTTYEALQLRVEKRFQNGSELGGGYTWSKTIGDTDTANGFLEQVTGSAPQGGPQDYYNPRGDRSIEGYDVPQRLVINYVLKLPFGKGQKYASGVQGVADKVVSGWAVNGITTFQSGFPVAFYENSGNTLTTTFGAGKLRPNVVPGCNKTVTGSAYSKFRNATWFNAACFTNPANYTFGNAPRNDGALRIQGVANYDLSLLKSTKIGERFDTQFRAEFFNIFNRTQFGPPGTGIGAAFYNQVSATQEGNNPRLMQLALRVNF